MFYSIEKTNYILYKYVKPITHIISIDIPYMINDHRPRSQNCFVPTIRW